MPANAQVILQLQTQAAPQLAQLVGGTRALTVAQLAQITAAQRLEQQTLKTAAAGRLLDVADQKVALTAAQAARAQDQAALAALRLSQAQDKAAKSGNLAAEFGNAIKSNLLGIIGPAAAVSAAFGVLRGSADAADQALQLREAQNALKAVSGSTLVYADAVSTAQRQQVLFGGSLQENIEGLQGLVVTSRDTGASLASLVDLSSRLNVKSPEQGIGGARIALQEAFSEGNITSLSRRFEIPKAALAAFKDESVSTADKVQILSQYLDSIGISSAAVAGKVDQTALAYRGLNAELERARLNAGGQLADAFARQATGLARLIGLINDNPQALAELNALRNGRSAVSQADIDQAARVIRVKNVLPAEQGARDAAFARDALGGTTANTQALDVAKNKLVLVAAGSDAAQLKVAALYEQFRQTGDIDAFNAGVLKIESSLSLGSRAMKGQSDALADLRAELAESAQASQADTAQKDAQQAATALLADKTKLAVDQFLALNPTIDASAVASAAAAAGYDPEIRKLLLLAVVTRDAKRARDELNGAAAGATEGRLERNTAQDLAAVRFNADANAKAKADALDKARVDQLLRTGTAAQVVTQRQKEYNDAVRQFGQNSAQAVNAQTNLIDAQQRAQAEAEKGARGRVSAAESTALSLANIERNSGDQQLRILRENQERLRDAQEDFEIGRARDQEDFDRDRLRLLAQGQRAQAARLADDFKRDQQREQEDFARQRRRTLRNNAEALGDQGDRVENQLTNVNARAAARGVRTSGLPPSPGGLPPAIGGAAGAIATSSPRIIQFAPQIQVVMDGKQVGQIIYEAGLREQIDEDLAIELAQIGIVLPPGGGNVAIAGARP